MANLETGVRPSLLYRPLEPLRVARPVDRIAYLRDAARGRTVLDIGALDETAYEAKQDDGSWLHLELAKVAKAVVGIDNSARIPANGIETSGNSRILRLSTSEIHRIPDLAAFDVVVAGEIIEHLPSAGEFLASLRDAGFRPGSELVMTTPNATALHNVALALARRESCHVDHVAVYSYKTLNTLCLRAGFSSWQLVPYFVRFTEMLNARRGFARLTVAAVEHGFNAVSWLFPMLAAGWILRVRL